MKRWCVRILFVTLLLQTAQAAAVTDIKLAILAPEGSTWHKVMNAWDEELRQQTGGRVALKIYAGAVLGDEKDVIRKMRIGQVHAAGLTGLGLGMINPEARVLDLPMLVSTYQEADALSKRIWPLLEKGFEKAGYVVLGRAETGFVNIFSNKPIASRRDLRGMKMWAWEGDQLVAALYSVFDIVPIPLPITDVITSLQTNLLDAVYAPPLGAIALQWFVHTKYITDLKLADSAGGIVVTKKALQGLSPADQSALRRTGKKYGQMLVTKIREDNEASYKTLTQQGLQAVTVPAEEVEIIRATSKKVWEKLVGKLYSQKLLDQAIAAVEEVRGTKQSQGAL